MTLNGLSNGISEEKYNSINKEDYVKGRGLKGFQKFGYNSSKTTSGVTLPLDLLESVKGSNSYDSKRTYNKQP